MTMSFKYIKPINGIRGRNEHNQFRAWSIELILYNMDMVHLTLYNYGIMHSEIICCSSYIEWLRDHALRNQKTFWILLKMVFGLTRLLA